MKATDLIFRETPTEGRFEMKSRVLAFIDEVKRHLQASAGKNKYRVIGAVQEMPTFEGPILPCCVSTTGGTKYPVNVEEMYICRDEREGFHNGTIVKVAQAALKAGQIKEA